MAKDTNQTIYLKDYTPPAYLIDKTELTFHWTQPKHGSFRALRFAPIPMRKQASLFWTGQR